jgi:hypothetical protein
MFEQALALAPAAARCASALLATFEGLDRLDGEELQQLARAAQ